MTQSPEETTTRAPDAAEAAHPPAGHPAGTFGARRWFAVVIVGLVGQIAWTLENMYLNVFVYDTITDDPTALAAMVAASAVAATIATLLIGAVSDRLGKRRIFIVVGYLLWGLSTTAFGFVSVEGVGQLVPVIDAVVATVLVVILLDCVMTVIGSSANDAAFNAWVTDVTTVSNRAKIESVLAALPLLSMLIVFGALDGFTRAGQWREFFAIIGFATMLVGVLAWFLIRDVPNPARQSDRVFRSIAHGLRPSVVRSNPALYLALSTWAVFGISTQIFLPYLIIYIQRTLKIEEYALVLAVVLLGAAVASVLGGRVIDRIGTVRSILPIAAIYVLGLALMAIARDTVFVIVAGLFMMSGFMLMTAAIGASVRNFSPRDRVGSVQGLRMIFAILLPMLIGPFIGAAVIRGAGETYEELGVAKQVPTAGIFVAAAVVTLFVLIPALALLRRERER
ncbi:MFS transporter [Sanguibacter gelidistatuariae]|uniref:MFS transporter n=1 Tax=Sanguibacter gelidistatuariae TaxID=1814289 RepID=UPI001FDEEF2A|nr:MFS transporter [Sanguibacter gelidistatuariae]